ncbi:MAG: hypothetical protein KDK54_22810 [Leptospiraceae bacterium]|nr:hypothetical protein [Leptospiraceae bacterium]MCB1557618.1 hypothetical protein [Alphaproteobacteria bacterium]
MTNKLRHPKEGTFKRPFHLRSDVLSAGRNAIVRKFLSAAKVDEIPVLVNQERAALGMTLVAEGFDECGRADEIPVLTPQEKAILKP